MADPKSKAPVKTNGPRIGMRALFFKKNMTEKPLAALVTKDINATEVRLVIFTPEGTVMLTPPERVTVVADVDITDPETPDNCCIIIG